MENKAFTEISKVERDPNLFVWFMTVVIVGFYAVTLYNQPAVRQVGVLLLFTGLTFLHIVLHWQLGKITTNPTRLFWYTVIQGIIALTISVFAQNPGMLFALFMGLLGEAIGLFGLTRRGWLAGGYYLALLNGTLLSLWGWAESRSLILTIIPAALFVVIYVTLYMRQTEAREQAQSLSVELKSANQQLGQYAVQVEELTLAAERQRMARELHDTLSQGVAGLVLQLEAIKAHLEAGHAERAATIVDQSLGHARSTLASSRAAIDDLRAIPLSLPEALRARVDRFTEATGIPCDLSLTLRNATVPPDTSSHLLDIFSEALANITRHARASQVWIRLEAQQQRIELEIQDDGRGFDVEKTMGTGHYGLLGMRERARLMGGRLALESGSGQGTCVRLVLPIPPGKVTV